MPPHDISRTHATGGLDCEQLDDVIEALAEGDELGAETAAHLAGCVRCQSRVELARELDRLLLSRETPAPPSGFTAAVLRRVRHERWRAEQVVDVGFNLAVTAGVLVILSGVAGLLWSLGWLSVDVAALSAAALALAPWTSGLADQAETLALAAILLSSALALWWWVEGGEASF